MSEDSKVIKVQTSNWNEFVFRFRSILEKHRLLDTISNDAVIRAAAVVQEALLDDFATAGAGGVMEMSTYDQNRYKEAKSLYDKYDKGVTEARNFIQDCTNETTFRIIRDIPFNDHYARFIALQRALQSTTTTAVRNDFKELHNTKQSAVTRYDALRFTQSVSEIIARIRDTCARNGWDPLEVLESEVLIGGFNTSIEQLSILLKRKTNSFQFEV